MKRFPFYKQLDSQDCGPTCIRMISRYYGKSFSAEHLRNISNVSKYGTTMLSLSQAAEALGFRTTKDKISFEQLRECQLPCITEWKTKKFIVVYDISKDKVLSADPSFGTVAHTHSEFISGWANHGQGKSGTVLLIQPTPVFYETIESGKKMTFSFFLNYLKPFKKYYLQLYLGMLVGMFLALITPLLMQSNVDIGINNQNIQFVQLILIAQLMLAFSSTLIGFIRSWIFLHMGSRISIAVISDYLIKLMKLPLAFFEAKKIGDITQRIGDHSRIQSFISATTLNTLFSFLNFIVFGIIMAYYNILILTIFFIGSSAYALWIILFMKKRKEFDYRLFEQNSQRQTALIQLISGIRDIKLHNIEKQKRWEWERLQVKVFKINIRQLTLGQYQQMGGFLIDQTKNILISYIAARSVIDGQMTFGMMLSMQFILGNLNSPVSQFLGLITAYQDAKISFERIREIHDKKNEDEAPSQKMPFPNDLTVSFENLSFSYAGPSGKKVIDNISFKIPEGKVTAIVGASGSGKTTLMKILLKFYTEYEGKIKIGNLDLNKINTNLWRERCGTVMQDGFIFSDTIAANIALGEEFPDLERLDFSATAANIKEFIYELELGYDTKLGSQGIGISQGQRQRILIARAVYRNPTFLLFDEATNSLDTKNEKLIVENLDRIFVGRTVLIIAHRLTTVKNADQIVVLGKGKVVEIGSHQELIEKKGAYYELVQNQLDLGK